MAPYAHLPMLVPGKNGTFSMAMVGCHHAVLRPWSRGAVFMGYNPLLSPFPLLLYQASAVSIITLLLRRLLVPLKQPLIVAQMLAGAVLGPSGMGRNRLFAEKLFPADNQLTLETLAHLGILYLYFFEGVKQDFDMITRARTKELAIAACGYGVSLLASTAMTSSFIQFRPEFAVLITFYPVLSSLTNFIVLQPILSEMKLLNTELGRLAMSIALLNNIMGLMLAALNPVFVLARTSPREAAWQLVSMLAFLLVLFTATRWLVLFMDRKARAEKRLGSTSVLLLMVLVMVAAFLTDFVGAGLLPGPILLALVVPPGPPLGSAMVEKTETVVHSLLLPIFFLRIGQQLLAFDVLDAKGLLTMLGVLVAGYLGKFVGTLLPALCYRIPARDGLALSLILSFKGISEVAMFSNLRELQLLDAPDFAIITISDILITAMAAPLVASLARRSLKPNASFNGRSLEQSTRCKLCLLACIYGDENVPSLINLLTLSHAGGGGGGLYLIHLVQLLGRGVPVLAAHDPSRPRRFASAQMDAILKAFRTLQAQNGGSFWVHPYTCISPYDTIHQDVTMLAVDKSVTFIVVPLRRPASDDESQKFNSHLLVARNVLLAAPCSVGIMVNKDNPTVRCIVPPFSMQSTATYSVGVLFLGGADDREALSYASRLVEHQDVSLVVLRCHQVFQGAEQEIEERQDNELIAGFRAKTVRTERVVYREKVVGNAEEMMSAIRSMGKSFDLMVVGRRVGKAKQSLMLAGLSSWSECEELGVIGDLLASKDCDGLVQSVLVVQQNPMYSCQTR